MRKHEHHYILYKFHEIILRIYYLLFVSYHVHHFDSILPNKKGHFDCTVSSLIQYREMTSLLFCFQMSDRCLKYVVVSTAAVRFYNDIRRDADTVDERFVRRIILGDR